MNCLTQFACRLARITPLLLLLMLTGCKPQVTFTGQSLVDDQGNQYGLLTWNVSGKTTDTFQLTGINIEPGVGPVENSGSLKVYPSQTTTYTLNVYANGPNNTVYNTAYHATIHIGPRVDYSLITDPGLHDCLQQTGFTHLEQFGTIYCVGRNIKSLAGMEQFTMTRNVALDNNQITDLSPLAAMPMLNAVSVSDNSLTSLDSLTTSTSIHDILAFNNQISDVSALVTMPQLLNLSLDNNQLTDITPLAQLTQLQGLSLAHNQITDVTPLGQLTGLLALNISDNGVTTGIPALNTLTKASMIRSNDNGAVLCLDYANLTLALGPVVVFNHCKLF